MKLKLSVPAMLFTFIASAPKANFSIIDHIGKLNKPHETLNAKLAELFNN